LEASSTSETQGLANQPVFNGVAGQGGCSVDDEFLFFILPMVSVVRVLKPGSSVGQDARYL